VSVFISWSGQNSASRRVAELFKKYIPKIIQGTSCYVSTQTEAGQVWVDTLFTELQGRDVGLLCVTRDNYQKPWINFEAGALAKNYGKARVCPVLIDLKPSDVPPPLSAFQMKTLEKEDVFSIFEMLNQNRKSNPLDISELKDAFEVRWSDFDRELKEAIASSGSAGEPSPRNQREILEEILETVRALSNGFSHTRSSAGDTGRAIQNLLAKARTNPVWTAENLHSVLIEKFRERRPLISSYVENALPVFIEDNLLFCLPDGADLAVETLSRPNNFKFLQEVGNELGCKRVVPMSLKRFFETAAIASKETAEKNPSLGVDTN
jgi:hypothetical protein